MSHIKGGGRTFWDDEAEEALVSLLLSIREPDVQISSEHDRKREHKRFVKKLVARHERRALARKLNQKDGVALETSTKSDQLRMVQGQADSSEVGTKKVRIELVEAVFGASKNSKKGGKSSGKDKSSDFKEGARKTMVFPSNTTVQELMSEARSKLRMKEIPTRCFVVEKKTSMNLTNDLRGIKDGCKIYVTSEELPSSEEKERTKKPADGDNGNDREVDPLDAVKRAYIRRKRPRDKIKHLEMIATQPPRFQEFFDLLPPLSSQRSELPAAACREEILRALDNERVLVVTGHTGSGKSTQVPQFILEGMIAACQEENAHILVTQPRRVAAISLAHRVACEMNSPAPGGKGSQVGYMVRLDHAVADTAKIVYCTVGILLRMLVCPKEAAEDFVEDSSDALQKRVPLSNVTHVVIDEVHERDCNTDFVLTLIRQVLLVNKNIRIILMSATAAADLFVRYFEKVGSKPDVIEISGRTFPVGINWIADCERFTGSIVQGWSDKVEESHVDPNDILAPRATVKIDNSFLRDLIKAIVNKQQTDGSLPTEGNHSPRKDGAILVFLPGKFEIESLAKLLLEDQTIGDRGLCKILKLHSALPKEEQQSIFVPARGATVKIILATNIAETSLTIPDVSHVVDTGRVKESRFNSSTRIKELVTVWTSQASAKQRAGRAGRTTAGTCWRLYSESFAKEWLPLQTSPEILRIPLDELILQLALLYENRRDEARNDTEQSVSKGFCPIRFLSKTPEPPSEESLLEACKHLLEVGAVVVVAYEPRLLYRLTPLGYHLSRLPMDAKVGKVLLVGCMLGCLENSLIVAAALSTTKSCFPSIWTNMKKEEWQACLDARKEMVERGFGGPNWPGGTVKGDLIATIATFREWNKKRTDKDRAKFCKTMGIDNVALKDMSSLRSQFLDCLYDAGFVEAGKRFHSSADDDALLTSCCLVSGLYPNICTLMRPRKGGFKGGRLITKDGDVCRPSSGSFQAARVFAASESGKDAYAVFHAKHRSIGTGDKPGDVFLSEVNFVSRFALLLFGGELNVEKNALIVDGWLKFKIGDKGTAGAVLIQELRSELDNVLLGHVATFETTTEWEERSVELISFVRLLLSYCLR